MSTTVIHAYNSPGPQTSQALGTTVTSVDLQDGWKNKASNLLCCFSSAGYYLEQARNSASQPWGQGTGELQVFAERTTHTELLGPQSEQHTGRMTLVLDLDGVSSF